MKRFTMLVALAAALALPAMARADFKGAEDKTPVKEGTFVFSLDYSLGTYLDVQYKDEMDVDVTDTVTQSTYAFGMRGTMYDWTKKTPLGSVPGIWFEANIGWIAAGQPGAEFGDDGGGGILWNTRMAGPWKILHTKNLKFGGGIGFTFGIQMGVPAQIRGEYMLAMDAFVMGVAEVKLGGLKTMFEGEYAIGTEYDEQRLYGHVALGKLTIGGQFILGQADVDYFQVGVNLGIRVNTEKF
jgi:hypothetical protein